jgi:hypothetical protein
MNLFAGRDDFQAAALDRVAMLVWSKSPGWLIARLR